MHSSVIPVTACECSVTVLVGIVDGVLLVGGSVATSVGARSPVGSTVLMLLVVLGPVEMYKYVPGSHFTKVVQ